mmetsp:Transcript_20875/g.58124  ORF Transcript_20875/g.58124 Transcript_20875/m.58124 type:complete len:116 (+) Transcript_20875:127-474(+)
MPSLIRTSALLLLGLAPVEEATKPKANTARGTPPLQNRAPKNQVVGGEYDRAFMTEVWLSNHDGKPNSLDYLIDGNGVRVRELIRFPAHRSASSLGMSLLGPWAAALLLVVGAQA